MVAWVKDDDTVISVYLFYDVMNKTKGVPSLGYQM